MGAFQAGFQLGGSMWDRAQQMSLAEAREAREAEEFARKKQGWQKADELEAQVKGLTEQITNPNASNYRMGGSPVGLKMPGQAAPADAAPGEMPPTDFSFGPAAAGGLKTPGAFALADTPGAAVATAPDAVGLRGSVLPADGVSLKAGPSASEEQAILAKIALLKGDIQGFNSARQAGKAADKDAVFAEAMKAPMPEVIAAAPKLNSMGIPLLYTGKSKDGKYTFLKTEADGYTPVDGSQFTLNESQMRQFYAASQLADKGFGADAMNLLSAANKDVADYIGKWNNTQSAVATANNTAQGKADEAEYRSGVLAETSRHNWASEANDAARTQAAFSAYNKPNYQLVGTNARGENVYADLSKLPQEGGVLNLPPGLNPTKAPVTLDDRQKIALGKALDAIAELPANTPQATIDATYRRFGISPELAGSKGLPGWGNNASVTNKATPDGQQLLELGGSLFGLQPRRNTMPAEPLTKEQRLRALTFGQ